MRKIQYLSPSSFSLWKKSKEDFYIRYLMENKVEREPQNGAMALGSAFDAYVKNWIFEAVVGRGDPAWEKFEFGALFEAQVESHNRDVALEDGKYVFEQYKSSGALGDLLTEIGKGSGLRLEFDIYGAAHGRREGLEGKIIDKSIISVPLMGKPDLSFITKDEIHLLLDFKVNGYYSRHNTSPKPGYVRLRSAGGTNHGAHKKAFLSFVGTLLINMGETLDDIDEDWGRQMSIYSWLTGESVGNEDFVVAIDQLVCNNKGGLLPTINVAEHRLRISGAFQRRLFEELVECWETVNSDWVFRDMSREDSLKRCEMLDKRYDLGNVEDPFLKELLG